MITYIIQLIWKPWVQGRFHLRIRLPKSILHQYRYHWDSRFVPWNPLEPDEKCDHCNTHFSYEPRNFRRFWEPCLWKVLYKHLPLRFAGKLPMPTVGLGQSKKRFSRFVKLGDHNLPRKVQILIFTWAAAIVSSLVGFSLNTSLSISSVSTSREEKQ